MEETKIYLVFTDTGTYLSKLINFFSKQSLNHVSLAFDIDLKDLYSFGRKQPRNPFSGGFVCEDITGHLLVNASCAVYSYTVSKEDYEKMLSYIEDFKQEQHKYRYNFLGLLGVLFNIDLKRERAFFCSQFVATVLRSTNSIQLSKPSCFITPSDLRNELDLQLIYQGILANYPYQENADDMMFHLQEAKPSLIFYISKLKQFVIR